MPGLAEIALGAAPIAGGALLGAVAGNMKGPDVRAVIKTDLDLLDRIPEDQVQRRTAMSQMIAGRIDDLIAADQSARQLRQAAANYQGDWRDVMVFICTVLFTIVWSGVVAFISYKIADLLVGLRVSEEAEREGLDITSHGETAYHR